MSQPSDDYVVLFFFLCSGFALATVFDCLLLLFRRDVTLSVPMCMCRSRPVLGWTPS